MAGHPYWQGQIRISLVQFGASLVVATKRSSQVPLHEYERSSGERIHHQDVTENGKKVKKTSIVKGFELNKQHVVFLEEDEITQLKLPSSDTFEIDHFVNQDDLPHYRFERPYYVMPQGKNAGEIYQVIQEALTKTGKAGIGQLAIRGREELCALMPVENGLMLQTLRYDAEFNAPQSVFKDLPKFKPKSDYAHMAEQLIAKNSDNPRLSQYHDRYHEALMELIEAKRNYRKMVTPKLSKKPAKVSNFMDALKQSLKGGGAPRSANTNKKSCRAA